MTEIKSYKDLLIWQKGIDIIIKLYQLVEGFPKEEIYSLTSQIRRAVASIPTNIAEGCGRNSEKKFNQFLNIALGSANETEYLLILSKDLKYLSEDIFTDLESKINTIKSKIYKLKQILIEQ